MTAEKQKSKWGYGIAALVVGFVIFILGIVMFASFQDFQLVETGYYERSLKFQEQIESHKRSLELEQGLEIIHQLDKSEILFSLAQPEASEVTGTIKLLRPSNARLDKTWDLNLDQAGQQVISTNEMVRGQWRIEVQWTLNSIEYYNETRIIIP
jgi:nitrogen fixation protein FixH